MTDLFLLVVFTFQYGELPMVFYGQRTDGYDDDGGKDGIDFGLKSHRITYNINDTAGNAGHGINVFAENERYFVNQYVPDDTTGGSCHATHDNGCPDRVSHVQCLFQPRDIE